MTHEHTRTELEHDIARQAPDVPDDATLARVSAAARAAVASDAAGKTSRRRPWLRSSFIAAAGIVAVAAVAFAVAGRGPHLTVAFAEQDALAALTPERGQIVHIKTRVFAKNNGDKEWMEDGSTYEESWIDFERNAQRQQFRVDATNELLSDGVFANGRVRYSADDPSTPDPAIYVSDMHGPDRVGTVTFWAYTYLPNVMDEGKVVGEVVQNGELCWDVRWTDSKDAAGNKMNARALFRQPDYRPLLIERDYPGGAIERWEVLEWTVLDRETAPSGTFDPKSIGDGKMPERFGWYAQEVGAQVDHPVYWAGKKVGDREIIADLAEPTPGDVIATPFVIDYLRFDQKADEFFDGDRTSAEYWPTDGAQTPVVISSGILPNDTDPTTEMLRIWRATAGEDRASTIGTASVARSAEGGLVALVEGDAAWVLVEAPDEATLDAALGSLKRFE